MSSYETNHGLLAQSILELLKKQFKIFVNYGHFWSFRAPVVAPMDPSPLILEVYHNPL